MPLIVRFQWTLYLRERNRKRRGFEKSIFIKFYCNFILCAIFFQKVSVTSNNMVHKKGHFERYEIGDTKMAYLTFSQNSFIWWNFVVWLVLFPPFPGIRGLFPLLCHFIRKSIGQAPAQKALGQFQVFSSHRRVFLTKDELLLKNFYPGSSC